MKRILYYCLLILCIFFLFGCSGSQQQTQILATTKPVYDFTVFLCENTGLSVELLVTENVSCLHDYTLQVRQMRKIETAELIILSGAGLEDFLHKPLENTTHKIDASNTVQLLCGHEEENHDAAHHHHDNDPHIWLSVPNARIMAKNIVNGLLERYPQYEEQFLRNFETLSFRFDELEQYGNQMLSKLTSRELITFHDGFGYFAEAWDLTILHALEEESGSEASAEELKELIELVRSHQLPAIFVEENGSTSASQIIANETGVSIHSLSMAMSQDTNYFDAMHHNINVIKEALG